MPMWAGALALTTLLDMGATGLVAAPAIIRHRSFAAPSSSSSSSSSEGRGSWRRRRRRRRRPDGTSELLEADLALVDGVAHDGVVVAHLTAAAPRLLDEEDLPKDGQRRRPRDQIKALYRAFNARDADAAADLLADDVVYEDLLLGASTICRGKAAFAMALRWHPAFVASRLRLPMGGLKLVVDSVACDGVDRVGVEWHVEYPSGGTFPLSRGLSIATLDGDGKLLRVVDICEAPWRVVGLVVRPFLTAGTVPLAILFGVVSDRLSIHLPALLRLTEANSPL